MPPIANPSAALFTAAFSYHQPILLVLIHGAALGAAWRIGSKTTRALASALLAAALLHSFAWLLYGDGPALHAFCSLVGLAFILPIVLRSRRFYPLVVGAAGLVSALAMLAEAALDPGLAAAALLLSALANLVMLLALAAALLADRAWALRQSAGAHPGAVSSRRSSVGNLDATG